VIPLSPALLLSAASAFAGLAEDRHGQTCEALVQCLVRQVLGTESPIPDMPWDAALVHHLGFWCHFDAVHESSSWPVPPLPSAEALAAFAKAEGVLVEVPEPGDLFLLWSPSSRAFTRTGVIVHVAKTILHAEWRMTHDCVTVDGDTDVLMSARGGRTLRHWRRFSGARQDRFVRWTELGRRAVPVRPFALPQLMDGQDSPPARSLEPALARRAA